MMAQLMLLREAQAVSCTLFEIRQDECSRILSCSKKGFTMMWGPSLVAMVKSFSGEWMEVVFVARHGAREGAGGDHQPDPHKAPRCSVLNLVPYRPREYSTSGDTL